MDTIFGRRRAVGQIQYVVQGDVAAFHASLIATETVRYQVRRNAQEKSSPAVDFLGGRGAENARVDLLNVVIHIVDVPDSLPEISPERRTM
jgi:hypothetical protein